MPNQKPIERKFPISEVNRIAEREAHAKCYYRPVCTMHKWWARRLGSVFRTIALYALTDRSLGMTAAEQLPFVFQNCPVAKVGPKHNIQWRGLNEWAFNPRAAA
jgi:putative DNA methylase